MAASSLPMHTHELGLNPSCVGCGSRRMSQSNIQASSPDEASVLIILNGSKRVKLKSAWKCGTEPKPTPRRTTQGGRAEPRFVRAATFVCPLL
eukprot:5209491-Amphidinium_carterae.3